MAKTIKYVGSVDRWPELPITGGQALWRAGQQEQRQDSEADMLLLTGLFALVRETSQYPIHVTPDAKRVATLPEGQALTISGAAGATGTVQRLDATGAVVQTWSVAGGALPPIGAYAGTQRFLITCTAGSIDATVGDYAAQLPRIDPAITPGTIANFQGPSNGNVATRMLAGRVESVTDNTAGYTWELTVTLAEHADAVRWIFAQSRTGGTDSATPNMLATMYAPTSFADVDAATFSQGLTFGGAGAIALAAPTTDARMAYTVSDWQGLSTQDRADGGTNPLVSCRVWVNGGARLCIMGKAGSDNYDPWASRPVTERQHRIRRSTAGGNQTGSLLAGAAALASNCPIIGVQYQARGRVYTIGLWGDSTCEGRDTYVGEGWVMKLAEKINAMKLGFKVETQQCGWSGATTAIWRDNLKTAFAAGLVPDVTMIEVCSPNNISTTITNALLTTARQHFALRAADTVNGKATKLMQVNFAPSNPSVKNYGSTDALRVAFNTALAANGIPTIDTSAVISGATDGNGQVNMRPEYNLDDIHFKLAGEAAIADLNLQKVVNLLAFK